MIKLKNIIFIYCLTILTGGLIPFYLSMRYPLQLSLDIVRTISIIATSIFALIYFDPFGLKKKYKEKQYENVVKLLELIVGKRITIDIKDNRPDAEFSSIFYQFYITRGNINSVLNKKDDLISNYLDYFICVVANDFFESKRTLIELKNNIWTPKEISKNITIFDAGILGSEKVGNDEVNIILTWNNVDITKVNFSNFINDEQISLNRIISQYALIIDSCEEWLKSHSFSSEEFNI